MIILYSAWFIDGKTSTCLINAYAIRVLDSNLSKYNSFTNLRYVISTCEYIIQYKHQLL